MKTFWSVFGKILILVVIVQWWFLYDYGKKNQQVVAENIQLEMDLLKTTDALHASESKVEELESRTLEHMMKETNKAVVTGWEQLLDTVSSELKKAKGAIHELSKPSEPASTKAAPTKPAPLEPQEPQPKQKKSSEPQPTQKLNKELTSAKSALPNPIEEAAKESSEVAKTLSPEATTAESKAALAEKASVEAKPVSPVSNEPDVVEKQAAEKTVNPEAAEPEKATILDKAGAMIDDIKEVFPDLKDKNEAPKTNSSVPDAPSSDVPSEEVPYPSVEGERT